MPFAHYNNMLKVLFRHESFYDFIFKIAVICKKKLAVWDGGIDESKR